MIAKSLATSAAEVAAGVTWENLRCQFYKRLDAGSGYYAKQIEETQRRADYYWSRLQAMA